MDKKSPFSKGVRQFREGVKGFSALLAAKACPSYAFQLFGIPSGVGSGIESGEGIKRLFYPPLSLSMRSPKTVDGSLYWKFHAILQGMEIPAEGLLELNEGIATAKGGNLAADGKLVTTFLQAIDGKPPHQHDLFKFSTKRFFPKIYQAKSPIVTLAAGWQGAFYHWVFEVLPRLHLVERGGHGEKKIFVEATTRFQKESLALLGLGPERIINAGDYAAVRAPQLIIPSIPETPTEWGCRFLREAFLPKIEKRPKFRLYVSRNDAGRRRIVNEEAAFALLKKYGFQKAELSALSFKEQIELFASAEVVAGPHGAGFSHLVFCDPGTPVLEIFSPAYINPCYWHVSERVGLPYYYLLGEGERYPDYFETRLDPDIEVDLAKLEASLKLMGL